MKHSIATESPQGLGEVADVNMDARGSISEESRVKELIQAQRLTVVFQPIIDLRSRQIHAYEVLARPDRSLFPGPVELFEAAAACRRAGELGRLVRTLALAGCVDWPLFINVHPAEFNEGYLVRPDDPMFAHDQPICLEITESVPLSHFSQCHSVLREVRSKGISLAVDDLGSGYSNLLYIADLAPEVVKLDRELIASVSKGPRHVKLVANIVRLCEELGAKVVVEGIETVDELRTVGSSGAHFAQGYLLARPSNPPPKMSVVPADAWRH